MKVLHLGLRLMLNVNGEMRAVKWLHYRVRIFRISSSDDGGSKMEERHGHGRSHHGRLAETRLEHLPPCLHPPVHDDDIHPHGRLADHRGHLVCALDRHHPSCHEEEHGIAAA